VDLSVVKTRLLTETAPQINESGSLGSSSGNVNTAMQSVSHPESIPM